MYRLSRSPRKCAGRITTVEIHLPFIAAAYAHAALEGMIEYEEAEPGRGKDVLPVTQADREDAVEKLQKPRTS